MSVTPKKISQEQYRNAGVIIVLCSAAVYAIGALANLKEEAYFGIFLANYAASVVYGCAIIFSRRLREGPDGLHCFILCLVLDLISAYALNHMIPVFEASVPWFTCTLVMVGAAYTVMGYMNRMQTWLRIPTAFVLGAGFILFVYLSCFLMPLYPIGLLGCVFLGISLHTLVPIFFVIFTIKWLIEVGRGYKYVTAGFFAGLIFSLTVIIIFSLQWNRIDRLVNRSYQRSLIADNTELPSWIKVAQRLPDNWLAEKYLKYDLVYTTPKSSNDWLGWNMPSRNFDEVRKHDPLVMIASFFNGQPSIKEEERIRILQSGFGARHKTLERLWRGDDLVTSNVVSNIRIWPELRLAYTEKTLTISRTEEQGRGWGDQEAIYTFHLPEGGVVTALSLWINNKEEKGILTTKGKADSAYRQIVGGERRDPSVVHWQEGNTVSVRVYPVPPAGNRIFKIGITAPLSFAAGHLHYDNIYFEGPDAAKAKEIVQVDWEGKTYQGIMSGFEPNGKNRFIKERDYEKDWQLSFPAPAMHSNAFSFNGKTYAIKAFQPQRTAADFKTVYLDMNDTWTKQECADVMDALKGKEVYVFDDGLIPLRNGNNESIFKRMAGYHFSLFPLQEIEKPATALLITKSGKTAPDINDLKDCDFGSRLDTWLQQGTKLKVFNLGTDLNPYLKTLKEHRAFLYEQGDVILLKQLLEQGRFAADAENQDRVVIDNAGIAIERSEGTAAAVNAPDHLMRLFAYNHLMQQLKQGLYTNHETDSTLVTEAQDAYVVSPLSSLVVLETVADYERFDIKNSKNSLQNASLKSKGAVPEPEEWALIIIAVCMLFLLYRKKYLSNLWSRF
jgi:XrtN system VIT domain protein